MLYKVRSSIPYIRAKIKWLNARTVVRKFFRKTQPSNSPETEFLPVICDNGTKVVQIALRNDVHRNNLRHPTMHLLVFSPDYRYLLVQRRASGKESSAKKLSQSVGGHVPGHPGMIGDYITEKIARVSLEREALEEAGMTNLALNFCGVYDYQGMPANKELVFVYTTTYEGKVTRNLSEVDWFGWFSILGIFNLAKKKPKLFAPSFLEDLKYLRKFWTQEFS